MLISLYLVYIIIYSLIIIIHILSITLFITLIHYYHLNLIIYSPMIISLLSYYSFIQHYPLIGTLIL
jgi:hypothetical protein